MTYITVTKTRHVNIYISNLLVWKGSVGGEEEVGLEMRERVGFAVKGNYAGSGLHCVKIY